MAVTVLGSRGVPTFEGLATQYAFLQTHGAPYYKLQFIETSSQFIKNTIIYYNKYIHALNSSVITFDNHLDLLFLFC
jgi:hypothetical protein